MSKEIGGYFQLDLGDCNNFPHKDGLMMQSLRSSLVHFLNSVRCGKIFIPKYCCPTIAAELEYAGIEYSSYHINSNFEPDIRFETMKADEYLFYVNYFGQCEEVMASLSKKNVNLIFDHSHSLFGSIPSASCHLYSPKKFAGLPDGGVMLCPLIKIKEPKRKDETSVIRMTHLLMRAGGDASSGYAEFKKNRSSLAHQPPRSMSNLTRRLIRHVDWEQCRKERSRNFLTLHKTLKKFNQRNVFENISGPFCYPLFVPQKDASLLRARLIEEKIYVPLLWPDINNSLLNQAEKEIKNSTLLLPVDQRYKYRDMISITNKIERLFEDGSRI